MRTYPLQYPHTLRYSRLDNYIDPTTQSFIRLPSKYQGSPESWVNYALSRIEKRQWTYQYLNNRLREWVSCLIFSVIMDSESPKLSSIINDVRFKVDAIGKINGMQFAIDFTEDSELVPSKLQNANPWGDIALIQEEWELWSLPFVVITIAWKLIDNLLLEIEWILEKDYHIPADSFHTHVQNYVRSFMEADMRPDLIFDIYSRSQRKLQERMNYLYNNGLIGQIIQDRVQSVI